MSLSPRRLVAIAMVVVILGLFAHAALYRRTVGTRTPRSRRAWKRHRNRRPRVRVRTHCCLEHDAWGGSRFHPGGDLRVLLGLVPSTSGTAPARAATNFELRLVTASRLGWLLLPPRDTADVATLVATGALDAQALAGYCHGVRCFNVC